eukprot:g29582.t1
MEELSSATKFLFTSASASGDRGVSKTSFLGLTFLERMKLAVEAERELLGLTEDSESEEDDKRCVRDLRAGLLGAVILLLAGGFKSDESLQVGFLGKQGASAEDGLTWMWLLVKQIALAWVTSWFLWELEVKDVAMKVLQLQVALGSQSPIGRCHGERQSPIGRCHGDRRSPFGCCRGDRRSLTGRHRCGDRRSLTGRRRRGDRRSLT